MSLIKKIKAIAEALDYHFFYDSGAGIESAIANATIADDETIVFAYLLSATSLSEGKESGQIGIFFYRLTEFDFGALENDAIQEETKKDAVRFLMAVDKTNLLTYSEPVSISRGWDALGANMTGVAITANFSEVLGVSQCLNQYYLLPEIICE